jgi:hypothetical protein
LNIKQFVRFVTNSPACFVNWELKPLSQDSENQLDARVGFAFGTKTNFEVDSNFYLAHAASRSSKPAIMQGEIAEYFNLMQDVDCISLANYFPEIDYVDSRHIADAAAKICKANGWTKIGVVAHPHHQWRCMMLLKKHGFEMYAIDCSGVSYSPNNDQPWVRGAWRLGKDLNPLNSFKPREVLARLLFLKNNWI